METRNVQEPPLTVGAVAKHFGVHPWQVRRVYERGLLPPAARVGAYRIIAVADLPLVEAALRQAGYLAAESEVPCAG
jgi:DNA-binding transcriptional MerR regulator